MNFKNFENLLDLFFFKYQSQEKKNIFLQSLSGKKSSFSWEETFLSIKKFSDLIKKNSSKGQRCLLISENRPEWFISDVGIQAIGAVSVGLYPTNPRTQWRLYLLVVRSYMHARTTVLQKPHRYKQMA